MKFVNSLLLLFLSLPIFAGDHDSVDPAIENYFNLRNYFTEDDLQLHDLTTESGVQQSNSDTRFVFRVRYHGLEVDHGRNRQFRLFEASVETTYRAGESEGDSPVPQMRIHVKPFQQIFTNYSNINIQLELLSFGFERNEQLLGQQGFWIDGVTLAMGRNHLPPNTAPREGSDLVPELGLRRQPIMSRLRRNDIVLAISTLGGFFGEINALPDQATRARILKLFGYGVDVNGTFPIRPHDPNAEWSLLLDFDTNVSANLIWLPGIQTPHPVGLNADFSTSFDLSFARRLRDRSREWIAFYARTEGHIQTILNTFDDDSEEHRPDVIELRRHPYRIQGEAGIRFQF